MQTIAKVCEVFTLNLPPFLCQQNCSA